MKFYKEEYSLKRGLNGWKVVKHFQNEKGGEIKKKTVAKELTLSDAETAIYKLENKKPQ